MNRIGRFTFFSAEMCYQLQQRYITTICVLLLYVYYKTTNIAILYHTHQVVQPTYIISVLSRTVESERTQRLQYISTQRSQQLEGLKNVGCLLLSQSQFILCVQSNIYIYDLLRLMSISYFITAFVGLMYFLNFFFIHFNT